MHDFEEFQLSLYTFSWAFAIVLGCTGAFIIHWSTANWIDRRIRFFHQRHIFTAVLPLLGVLFLMQFVLLSNLFSRQVNPIITIFLTVLLLAVLILLFVLWKYLGTATVFIGADEGSFRQALFNTLDGLGITYEQQFSRIYLPKLESYLVVACTNGMGSIRVVNSQQRPAELANFEQIVGEKLQGEKVKFVPTIWAMYAGLGATALVCAIILAVFTASLPLFF